MRLAKTIINSFLAFTLLIATTGMTLNKHYCMGRLKAVAINETASPCVDQDGEPVEMPCCEDISEELKVEEITQVSFDFDSQPDLYELAIITWITLSIQDDVELENPQFQYYAPPPPDIDFQVNHQVFLI